jgi:hypothetical protein
MIATSPQKSPFKFLDPYGKEDVNFFFGRETEIDKLYQSVNKNRIVLVYGLSGTGKTSLVQCGLTDRFDATEWIPFFVRRGANLNDSLREALIKSKVVGGGVEEMQHPKAVVEYLKLISKRYLRSVFLIFDQFEELLILGDDEEKQQFLHTLHEIILSDDTQFCNFIFILREEYFAQLDLFEELIPGFSDRRLRVEQMRPGQVADVITKTCKYFNIRLEHGDEDVKEILHRLTEKSGIHLPYVQIYLDQLWREDFERTYPNGYNGSSKYPALEFTSQEIQSFGDIRAVTRRFLSEQLEAIKSNLKKEFPSASDDTLSNILDAFVTDKGTKMPIPFSWRDEERIFGDNAPLVLRNTDKKLLEFCIKQLEYRRILRIDASTIELVHDNIADYIFQKRSRERRNLDEIARQITTRYEQFGKTKEYLSKKEIVIYEDAIPLLNLNEAQKKFFTDSKRYHERKAIVKAGGWILIALVAFYIFHAFQTNRLSDSQFASLYLGFRIDSITDKRDALRVAKYIYDKDVVSSEDQALFREKFVKIFQSKEIQTLFSNYHKVFTKTIFKPEDFQISDNGSYYAIDTSFSTGKKEFVVYDTASKDPIATFKNAEYAYFINRPNILLVASSIPVYINSQPITLNYPNQFVLYDCEKRDSVRIWAGMQWVTAYSLDTNRLYGIDDISNPKSEFDSYRVRFTFSDNLIIPYLKKSGRLGTMDNKVKILSDHRLPVELNSTSTVSISKDGQFLATGNYENGKPVVKVYNENGEEINAIPNIYFADFTPSGWVTYIRKGTLVMMDASGDTSRQYVVDPMINYAFGDNQNKTAIARSNQQLFLVDLETHNVQRFKDSLVGIDFAKKTFITEHKAKVGGDSLIQRDFSGGIIHTYQGKEPFKQITCNSQTGEVLILTKSLQLIWLNDSLQIHTGFQLTTNDLYGFSKDGSTVYYIRDDYLCFFPDKAHMIDLSDFDQAYAWFNATNTKEQLQLTKEEKKKYQLHFPSDNLLWKSRD